MMMSEQDQMSSVCCIACWLLHRLPSRPCSLSRWLYLFVGVGGGERETPHFTSSLRVSHDAFFSYLSRSFSCAPPLPALYGPSILACGCSRCPLCYCAIPLLLLLSPPSPPIVHQQPSLFDRSSTGVVAGMCGRGRRCHIHHDHSTVSQS